MTIGDPHPFRPAPVFALPPRVCDSCGGDADDEIHDIWPARVMPGGEEPTMPYDEQSYRPRGYQSPTLHTAQQVAELEKRVASLERTQLIERVTSTIVLSIRIARLVRARRAAR